MSKEEKEETISLTEGGVEIPADIMEDPIDNIEAPEVTEEAEISEDVVVEETTSNDDAEIPFYEKEDFDIGQYIEKTEELRQQNEALVKMVNEGKFDQKEETPTAEQAAPEGEVDYNAWPYAEIKGDEEQVQTQVHDFLVEFGRNPLKVLADVIGPSIRYYTEGYVGSALGKRDFASELTDAQPFVEQHKDQFEVLLKTGLSEKQALSALGEMFPTKENPDTDSQRDASKRGGKPPRRVQGSPKKSPKDLSTYGENSDTSLRDEILGMDFED